MFKRKTALFFTLFAYSILLALAVLPHHHHEGEICVINAVCHAGPDSDEHNHTGHNHDHNSSDENRLCILEQEIIIRSNNLEHFFKALDPVKNQPGFDGFRAVPNESDSISYILPVYSRAQSGFKYSLYSCYVSQSIGLRGPPTA